MSQDKIESRRAFMKKLGKVAVGVAVPFAVMPKEAMAKIGDFGSEDEHDRESIFTCSYCSSGCQVSCEYACDILCMEDCTYTCVGGCDGSCVGQCVRSCVAWGRGNW